MPKCVLSLRYYFLPDITYRVNIPKSLIQNQNLRRVAKSMNLQRLRMMKVTTAIPMSAAVVPLIIVEKKVMRVSVLVRGII